MKRPVGSGSNAPTANRPNNIDQQLDPKKTYRKARMNTPFEIEQRRLSFKRNRDKAMRRLMKS